MTSLPDGQTPAMRCRTPVSTTLWGDGFAQDTFYDMWAVRDWSLCSPDEYVFLFPRLVPLAGEFPTALRVHLESCISARAWRLARLSGHGDPIPLRARLPDRENAAARHRDWFADDDAVTCLLRRVGLLRTATERLDAERRLLAFLDDVLFDIQAYRRPPWDEVSEALLAFGAGIHPAYLWPEATVSHARGVAAGWLGHLDRGRTMLMPMVVAEYVLDALGGETSSDRQLIALAGGAASLGLLRRAACRRSAGQDRPVRLAPDAASFACVFSGWTRTTHPSEAKA